MKYDKVVKGTFIERPNRFIARVEIEGKTETVHVKNTGRCRELLIPGAEVYLSVSDNPARKTKYDLIAVLKKRDNLPDILVNMDSQIPNSAAEEWLKSGALFGENAVIRREVSHGKSRFDFCIEDSGKTAFLEVKGVTLENGGIVSFPDAPTERGVKHVSELIDCLSEGYESYILFVIQMRGVDYFTPSDKNHPEFGEILRKAEKAGVKIIAADCNVTPDEMTINSFVPVRLD